MAYQGSFKLKGSSTSAGATISASNFGRAHFVRVQTQAAANTVTVKEGSDVIGTIILVTAGDSVVIEKDEAHTVETTGNAVGSAVSSSR
jgi:mannose-6-phosphate isomerase-like protein (cupin superfamily)